MDTRPAPRRSSAAACASARTRASQDRYRPRCLAGLRQRQDVGQLVERTEAAGKHDERTREVREPELAHEEIAELEQQLARDVRVRPLLVRKPDVEPDRPTAGLSRTTVRRLHDAASAAGADNVSARIG